MTAKPLLIIMLALSVTACASAPGPTALPDYAEVTVQPPPAHARLYADCLQQAATSGRYGRASDGGDTELLLFTCTGAPAAAFYAALGPWSTTIGSEFQNAGRTYRSTARIQRNLFGVDHCSAADDADHRCVLSFNAGDFLVQ